MINLIYANGQKMKEKELRYVIMLLDGSAYEADSYTGMAAAVCGMDYQDCEAAETAKMMRISAAKRIGLSMMAAEDIALMSAAEISGEEIDQDDARREPIIIYDEAIGKIPYSYTDAAVDYDIHGAPELIRVECDETFILSLAKNRFIAVFERNGVGEYVNVLKQCSIDEKIDNYLELFKIRAGEEKIPLHKAFSFE